MSRRTAVRGAVTELSRARKMQTTDTQPGGVLLGIIGRGVPLGTPNPDLISDQNMPFSQTRFQTWLLIVVFVFVAYSRILRHGSLIIYSKKQGGGLSSEDLAPWL